MKDYANKLGPEGPNLKKRPTISAQLSRRASRIATGSIFMIGSHEVGEQSTEVLIFGSYGPEPSKLCRKLGVELTRVMVLEAQRTRSIH